MRYFQSFFKHTWRPQQVHQMDAPSRFEPTKTAEMRHTGETELAEVRVTTAPPASSVAISTLGPMTKTELPCRNGGCKVWRSRSEPRTESPWHTLKTVFLVSVIAAFLLWVVVYTLLNQYRIL